MGTVDQKPKTYKPKDSNVKKLNTFLEKQRTTNSNTDGGRRFKNTKQ